MSLAPTSPPANRRLPDSTLLPPEIRTLPNWVVARRRHKIPLRVRSLRNASVTDPGSWSNFDEAVSRVDGSPDLRLGFVLPAGRSVTFVDLDSAIDESGEVRPWAREVLDRAIALGTFVERSISGRGFHILVAGSWDGPNRIETGAGSEKIEAWDHGRFLVLGEPLPEAVPRLGDGKEFLAWIRGRFAPKKPRPAPRAKRSRPAERLSDHRRVTAAEFAARCDGAQQRADGSWLASCPAHDDRSPSLSLTDGDGATLVHCFAGCEPRAIAESVGLSLSDLFDEPPRATHSTRSRSRDETSSEDEGEDPNDPRPKIALSADEHLVAAEVLEVLARSEDLFVNADRLVEVARTIEPGEPERYRIAALSKPQLRERIAASVRLIGSRGRAAPPEWLVNALADRGEYPRAFRRLTGISRVALLRPDGTVADASGYDRGSGVLIVPADGSSLPSIPERPSRDEGVAAVSRLLALVAEFPFADDAARSGWLAFLLTLVGRRAIAGSVPLFAFDGTSPGCGKSLLVRIAAEIAHGEAPAFRSWSSEAPEQRKSLTAALADGASLVVLDNVVAPIGGDALASLLTAERWEDRILGSSRTVRFSTRGLSIAATGNSLGVDRDLARRVLLVRLVAAVDQLERRPGAYRIRDLVAHVRQRRAELLADALIALRAYIAADRPEVDLVVEVASFEAWSSLVRSAVVWLGLADPFVGSRAVLRERDGESARAELLLAAVEATAERLERPDVLVAEIVREAEQDGAALPDSLRELSVLLGPNGGARLGVLLRGLRDSIVGGRVLRSRNAGGGVKRWWVESFAPAGGEVNP